MKDAGLTSAKAFALEYKFGATEMDGEKQEKLYRPTRKTVFWLCQLVSIEVKV